MYGLNSAFGIESPWEKKDWMLAFLTLTNIYEYKMMCVSDTYFIVH